MTTNQMIVLLDVHRGFSRPGHTATLNADLGQLERKGMIAMGSLMVLSMFLRKRESAWFWH